MRNAPSNGHPHKYVRSMRSQTYIYKTVPPNIFTIHAHMTSELTVSLLFNQDFATETLLQ